MKRTQSTGKVSQPKKQYAPSDSTRYQGNPASVWQPVPKAGEKKDVTAGVLWNPTTYAGVAGQLTLLNGMVYGGTAGQHIGRSVTLRSIAFNTALGFTSTGGAPILRVLIVYDRQPNGAAPAVTDILYANDPSAPMNLNNSKRFKVLHDWRPDEINPTAGAGISGPAVQHSFYRKLQLPMEFNTGSTGTIADITTGSIYALTFCTKMDAGAAVTLNHFTTARVRFTD